MGAGNWDRDSYRSYSKSVGRTVDDSGYVKGNYSAQEMFRNRHLDEVLNPFNAIRECCDSEEHPNTIPVILALDVTGSMGEASVAIAKQLNPIISKLYEEVKDVEFMIMGIGDLAYDDAPIQTSQFESDIRIAEQLDKLYFEGGGGGNGYESYTAAWYFGVYRTKLDCFDKRGKKGIIITLGDEPLNPYLPEISLKHNLGVKEVGYTETDNLYRETIKKFDVYHLAVNDKETCYRSYDNRIRDSFGKYLDDDHLRTVSLDGLEHAIVDIIKEHAKIDTVTQTINTGIVW